MGAISAARCAWIIEELRHREVVKVAELSRRFGVSAVSIRHDLRRLEELGVLKRVYGGAIAVDNGRAARPAPVDKDPRAAVKRRIGQAAAALISQGDRLIFDSGTTALAVAQALPGELRDLGKLTVITNSLPIARELGSSRGLQLILLGGIYLPQYQIAVGPQTLAQLRDLHADRMFVGADGLSLSHGVTTASVLEAEVDRAAIAAAREIIVVADASKINQVGLTTILPLSGIHKLITDTGAPGPFIAALRAQGVEVILV